MAKLVRKNVFLDPEILRRAQAILGTQSESEATARRSTWWLFAKRSCKGLIR